MNLTTQIKLLGYSVLAFFLISFGTASELRVASYNIKHGEGMDGKLDLDRQVAVLRALNVELIALQEVDRLCKRSGEVDQAKYLAEKLGMHHVFGKAIKLGKGEYGQAILSKYPIKKSIVHKLPSSGEARIVLEVQVDHPKIGSVSLCSAHYSYMSKDIRMPQVLAFEKVVADYKHPVILTGDYNATPESETMHHYSKTWILVGKEGDVLTHPADKPTVEIDFCSVKNFKLESAASFVVDEPLASDHRPLLTVFKLQAKEN